MRLFLALHGHQLGWGLLAAGALLGWVVAARLSRWWRRRAALGALADAPLARGPDYPTGRARVQGVLRASGGRLGVRTYAAGRGDIARASVRAERLWLVTASGVDVELRGTVHVASAGGPGEAGPPREVRQAEIDGQLPMQERWPFDELPVEVRTMVDGSRVEVFGRLERVADGATAYRERAARVVLAADDPVGILVMASRAPLPWRRSIWGAALGVLPVVLGLWMGGNGRVPALRFVSPSEHDAARGRLVDVLRIGMRNGSATTEDLELLLVLTASGDVGGRARVLEAMGRHDRAIELVWDSTEDPLSRAERLRDLGWYDEADAALRDIEGREARAAQVENALARDGRSLMDCRPIELERAVRRVCGDDLGCAVTSRLLSVGTWPRPNPVVALFGGPTPDLERATWMLRMADAVEAPPPSVLAARIRWRAELAIAQLQLGAVDAAWRSIEAAHHDYRGLGEGWWSDERQRLRRLRAVAHLRDGHPERAHGRDWIFGPLVAIAQGDDTVAWPYADGVPPFERRRALAARRPIALDFPPTAEGYEEIVWSAHRLTPDARERLASELRRSPETVQTPVRQTSRARALRALGDETTARAIEAEVRRLRVAEYGW